MSTTPPPPFGTTPGPAPSPIYDRQTLRLQRRAAAAQARWQRDQIRLQMRAARRTSIVGPLLLVGIGVVLLLLTSDRLHWPDVLAWLGRWWPAILIGAGLLMLAEWTLDRFQMSRSQTALAPRRTLGGGTIGLLLLLAFIGACVMAAENGSRWATRNLDQNFSGNAFGDWSQFFGVKSEFTEDLHAALGPDGALTIDDPRGDVMVTGSSEDGQVHVTVRQHVYTWHQDEVDARRRTEQATLSGDHAHLTLAAPSRGQDDADMTVELPHDASLIIHSGHGDVSVEELRGAAEVFSNNGDVKLTALTGPVHLRTQDDNTTITAHSLGAGLNLDGHSGDISLSDIDGPVVLHGDFFGTTHLERIRGTVNFQSSFTNFACAAIPGELNIDGRSDLDAHQLDGPVTLATTDRNLSLNGIRGGATITNRNGSVALTVAAPAAPVHVTNANGSINVALPPNQGFGVDVRTENGEIENDFDLTPEKTGDTSQLRGKISAGGPNLDLQTTEGDITVRRASADELPDWSDAPQRLTLKPAKPHPLAAPAATRHAAQ